MIINEWQLNSKLNKSLQAEQRADFSLLLAFMSPCVDESAQFLTPQISTVQPESNLYRQLGIATGRDLVWQNSDADTLYRHARALNESGLAQLKLCSYLIPPPLAEQNDAKRIDKAVWQNLSMHCRRRLSTEALQPPEADLTALYDVLQQVHAEQAA